MRGLFGGAVAALRAGRIDAATWDSLEEALIRADVGVTTADALLADLRAKVESKEIRSGDDLLAALGHSIRELLQTAETRTLRFDGKEGAPDVWLIVGVNGVGKTTTIGKLARRESAAGHSVLLAAGDTFRAAAADQLAMWAERTGTEIVRGAEGGDPSAIVFDAVQRAAARGNDLVLADTAGRLHTKVNLVEELKKIRRIADRDPGNVTEVLLVLDATTGQNALAQARQFTEAVDVTGIVLTKLDGTAKGGIVIAVQRELGLPVKLVGLGEGLDDLVDFDPDEFVDASAGRRLSNRASTAERDEHRGRASDEREAEAGPDCRFNDPRDHAEADVARPAPSPRCRGARQEANVAPRLRLNTTGSVTYWLFGRRSVPELSLVEGGA